MTGSAAPRAHSITRRRRNASLIPTACLRLRPAGAGRLAGGLAPLPALRGDPASRGRAGRCRARPASTGKARGRAAAGAREPRPRRRGSRSPRCG
jgi:hypothetical protein